MKYVKMLGLLAVAAAAMMAFAGVASADTATSPHGVTYTGNIHATHEGPHVNLHGSNGVTVSCKSTVTGKIDTHGPGKTVEGNITALSFTDCTNGEIVHVVNKGRLSAHAHTTKGGAILTASGVKVEITTTIFGFPVTCGYETGPALSIGTLTGSTETGGHATLDITATIPRTYGSGLCGNNGVWTGGYTVTTPANLNIDKT